MLINYSIGITCLYRDTKIGVHENWRVHMSGHQYTTKALTTFIDVHSLRVFVANCAINLISSEHGFYAQFIEFFCK